MDKNDNRKLKIQINPKTRSQLIYDTDFLISQLQDRLSGQRFRPTEGDETKIQYLKVYISALHLKNELLRDAQLDDLAERFNALEAAGKPKTDLFDF